MTEEKILYNIMISAVEGIQSPVVIKTETLCHYRSSKILPIPLYECMIIFCASFQRYTLTN